MSGTRKIILGAFAVMALMAGASTAFADKPNNQSHDDNRARHESDNSYIRKSYTEQNFRIHDQDKNALNRYAQAHYKKYCPAGQAKKSKECLQYGQKQKRYEVGRVLPKNVLYYPLPRDVVVNLRPVPTGYQYVRVDNDVLLMNTATKQIIDAVILLVSAKR